MNHYFATHVDIHKVRTFNRHMSDDLLSFYTCGEHSTPSQSELIQPYGMHSPAI